MGLFDLLFKRTLYKAALGMPSGFAIPFLGPTYPDGLLRRTGHIQTILEYNTPRKNLADRMEIFRTFGDVAYLTN